MAVPYTFSSATSAIPLSQLDSNFATTITLGNTAIQLGNTVTTLNNMTLANVTVTTVSGASANAVVYTNSSGQVTANSSVIALDTSGNLGLGVTPSAWNSVFKAVDVGAGASLASTGSGNARVFQNAYYSVGGAWTYRSTDVAAKYEMFGDHSWFVAPSGTAGTTVTWTQAMRLDASGNLGVGTTSPTARLHVASANTAVDSQGNLFVTTTDSYAINTGGLISLGGKYTSGGSIANFAGIWGRKENATDGNYAGYLAFGANKNGTGVTEAARIDSSGNLLVGTTGLPNGTSVYGFGLGPATNGRTVLYQASNQTTSQTLQAYYNPNGNVGSISTSGSLTSYNISSDYRLKENIVPLTGGLSKISALKPSVYNYKSDPSTQIEGFIAHELAEVCPHAVTGEKDATTEEEYEITPAVTNEQGEIVTPAVMGTRTVPVYQGVDASFLIPHLVAAVQELAAKVAALKGTK